VLQDSLWAVFWGKAEFYRFGFNGKEMDNETSGTRNMYDYGFRIYNPRIAKFLSVDPLTHSYPMLTPYQFSSNSPISMIDLDGLEAAVPTHYSVMWGKKMALNITNWFKVNHEAGMGYVESVKILNEDLKNVPGYEPNDSWYYYTKLYLHEYSWDIAPYSDADDASVIMYGKTVHNEDATLVDYTFAAGGLFIPFISGSAIKESLQQGTKYIL
jgi:RHS repeat-associated protein